MNQFKKNNRPNDLQSDYSNRALHLEEDYPIITFFKKKRSNGPILSSIYKFEGCCLRGQVSCFNGCIVDLKFYWSVCQKKPENLLFSKNVVIG